ncbi:hypothetical protein JCM8547_003865 [Rhodosporidiobolus lusitaniae]
MPAASPTPCAALDAPAKSRRPRKTDDLEEQRSQEPPLSTWSLLTLASGLGATQFAWSVQNAYGTPYMNSLGIPAQWTALVWLASPFAGLIVQPSIGPLSDETPGRFRRRSWLIASSILTFIALGWTSWADAFPSAFAITSSSGKKGTTIAVAVGGLWTANFALNGMQATVRDLLLDQSPAYQQPLANAYATRFADVAATLGYLAGYFRLSSWSALDWMSSSFSSSTTSGNTQFRKLVLLSIIASGLLVVLVCATQKERDWPEEKKGGEGKWRRVWRDLWEAVRGCPVEVRRVCYIQILAWIGYNALLVYSTTYISYIVYSTTPSSSPQPSSDEATRYGSFALVLYSLVALASSIFFPWLASLGGRPAVLRHLSSTSSSGRFLRKVLSTLTPRNLWTLGLLVFAAALGGATFTVKTVGQAQAVIAVVGFSWAVGEWVPYALVLETVRELEQAPKLPPSPTSFLHASLSSSSPTTSARPGGTLLGLHATSIVLAKIVLSCCASLIFKLTASADAASGHGGKSGAVWVLRLGGLAGLGAAAMSRWTRETASERRYREGLLSAREEGEERQEEWEAGEDEKSRAR